VLTLRCTARLLDRLKTRPEAAPAASTTRLGDWYANLLHIGRIQLVLAVSERTLLPVLIPASPASSLVPRLRVGVVEVLRAIGVPEEGIREEEDAMSDDAFAKTNNRVVVGVMVEFAKALEFTWESHATLLDASLYLAGMVCMPLRPDPHPDSVTRKLFAAARA
jgi:hypothetical protein